MQVLWSRVAQTRSSCRCTSCLQPATAITRRAATAASRRQIKFSDVLTACYSTILAAAALADAKVKEDRRKQWDRVISEAKAGVFFNEDSRASQHLRNNGLQRESIQGRSYKSDGAEDEITRFTSEALGKRTQSPSLLFRDRSGEAGHLDSSVVDTGHQHSRLAQDDLAENRCSLKFLPPREPVTDLHLFMDQRHTGRLIYQLLVASGAELAPWWRFGLSTGVQLAERVTVRKLGFTTSLPAYSWPSDLSVAEERRALHAAITKLREAALVDFNVGLFVTKVCYNLLVTTTPPSIDTYNLLIESFTQLGRHDLTGVVIDRFFRYSRFRPNTTTITLMLNHYHAARDADGFRMIIRRLAAVDGDLRIRKRELFDLSRTGTQKWALTRNVVRHGDFLSQRVVRTKRIFEAMIRGSLDVTSLTSAIRYLRAALREGWQIDAGLIWDLIKACVDRVDHTAAKSLMVIISSQWRLGMVFPAIDYTAEVRQTIYCLLHLCRVRSSSEVGPVPVPVQTLLRHMRLQAISEAIERFCDTIQAVKITLSVIYFEPPMAFERAVRILRKASKSENHLFDQRNLVESAQRFSLKRVMSRLDTISHEIRDCQKELLSILGCRLSPRGRALYGHCVQKDGPMTISSRLDLLSSILECHANRLESPRLVFLRQPGIDSLTLTTREILNQKPVQTVSGRIVSMKMSPRTGTSDQPGESLQSDPLAQAEYWVDSGGMIYPVQEDTLSAQQHDSLGEGDLVDYFYTGELGEEETELALQTEPVLNEDAAGMTQLDTELPPNDGPVLPVGESKSLKEDDESMQYAKWRFSHSIPPSRLSIPPALPPPVKLSAYM